MANLSLTLSPVMIATVGGIIPALLWLFFWLHEDNKNPEPKGLLIITFLAGMAMTGLIFSLKYPIVTYIFPLFSSNSQVMLMAAIEELVKFAVAFFIAFKSIYYDEPIDAVIYLVTAALGFAAAENILYILGDLAKGGTLIALLNGSSRFIGATILHTISSILIGIAMAYTFYSNKFVKTVAIVLGLTVATLLHTYFNLTIIGIKGMANVLIAFTPYWAAIVGIIVVLEFVKRLKQPTNNS